MAEVMALVTEAGDSTIHILIEHEGEELGVTQCGNGNPQGGQWGIIPLEWPVTPDRFCADCFAGAARYLEKRRRWVHRPVVLSDE